MSATCPERRNVIKTLLAEPALTVLTADGAALRGGKMTEARTKPERRAQKAPWSGGVGGLDSATELRAWWEKVPPGCMVEVRPRSKFGRSLAALFGSVRAFCRISDRASAEYPQKTPHERILAALRSKEGGGGAELGDGNGEAT